MAERVDLEDVYSFSFMIFKSIKIVCKEILRMSPFVLNCLNQKRSKTYQ